MADSKGHVVFCHGLESGPSGSKIKALAAVASQKNYQVTSPSFEGIRDPAERVKRLVDSIPREAGRLVLAGSSMGAYVAAVASRTLEPAGLFLLAPAFFLDGYAEPSPEPNALYTSVVHGLHDELIPPGNSFRYCTSHGVELHLADGDHRLKTQIPFLCETFANFLDRLDRISAFTGCLLGECLADALGFPAEARSAAECRAYVEGFIRTGRVIEVKRRHFGFGQYSDDSQLARELLISFVGRAGFDPVDYAVRLKNLFVAERIVGIGRATREALSRFARGCSWEECGTPAPAAGNGTAMRAGPVGLLFQNDPSKMIQVAHDQGRITHHDPRCSAGSVAIAGAVALAPAHGAIDPAVFCKTLAGWTSRYDPVLSRALSTLPALLDSEFEQAWRSLARVGWEDQFREERFDGISGFVTPGVLWSVYSFLKHPDNYLDAVCHAISGGGDVDTTAAMTGAISGSRTGFEGLPGDLLKYLNDHGEWKAKDLIVLARRAAMCAPLDRVTRPGPFVGYFGTD